MKNFHHYLLVSSDVKKSVSSCFLILCILLFVCLFVCFSVKAEEAVGSSQYCQGLRVDLALLSVLKAYFIHCVMYLVELLVYKLMPFSSGKFS